MPTTNPQGKTSVISVYKDHASAEDAVRGLQGVGIPMQDISIVGREFELVEKPLGFVTTGSTASAGAKVGSWTGGIFGLLLGAAFLVLPGIGPVIVAGPLSAALVGAIEGALAGAAFGGLTGMLVGLGFSKDKAIRYESEIRAGKFLVTVRCDVTLIDKVKAALSVGSTGTPEAVAA